MPILPPLLLMPSPIPTLSPAGAIENQPKFRQAAKNAYYRAMGQTMRTGQPTEGEFVVNSDGHTSPIKLNSQPLEYDAGGNQTIYDNDIAAFHTHPLVTGYSQYPSPADIQSAKQTKRTIMVASHDGLYEIDALGNVRKVFDGTNWMNRK